MDVTIGIDPGHASGGVCVLARNMVWWCKAPRVEEVFDMHEQLEEYLVHLQSETCWGDISDYQVYIEQVSGRRSDGGSRAFNFGMGYGVLLQSFLERFRYVETVRPQRWQQHFDLYGMKDAKGKKMNTTDKKNVHKDCAKQLLREDTYLIQDHTIEKLPHWKTDSYLIAQWGRDMRG